MQCNEFYFAVGQNDKSDLFIYTFCSLFEISNQFEQTVLCLCLFFYILISDIEITAGLGSSHLSDFVISRFLSWRHPE